MRKHHTSGTGSTDAFCLSPTAAERGEMPGGLYIPNANGAPPYQYTAPVMATRHRVEESSDSTSHFCFTRPPPSLVESARKRSRRKSIWVLKEYPTLFASYNNAAASDTRARGPGAGAGTVNGLLSGRKLHSLPTKLLRRFHVLCVILTLLGFIFSLIGIVCNVWERLPHVVGIVCTIFVCTTLLIVLGMLFIPDVEAEEHPGYSSG